MSLLLGIFMFYVYCQLIKELNTDGLSKNNTLGENNMKGLKQEIPHTRETTKHYMRKHKTSKVHLGFLGKDNKVILGVKLKNHHHRMYKFVPFETVDSECKGFFLLKLIFLRVNNLNQNLSRERHSCIKSYFGKKTTK